MPANILSFIPSVLLLLLLFRLFVFQGKGVGWGSSSHFVCVVFCPAASYIQRGWPTGGYRLGGRRGEGGD